MEEVGYRRTVRGRSCTVAAPGVWEFWIEKGKKWRLDTVRDTLQRCEVVIFFGVGSVADAVLLATGWENAMADVWRFAACKMQAIADGIARKHPAAMLVHIIREGSK